MKVILNQDVKGIGKKLQLVDVSEGYARNFLLPKNLAKIADNTALSESKTKSQSIKFKKDTETAEAEEKKANLEKGYISFKAKTGENGKLFGSITEKEISDEIKKVYKLEIDKKKIVLDRQIKEIGSYVAKVKLYEGVIANIKISVVGI